MTTGTFQVPAPQPNQLAGRIEASIVDPGGAPPDILKVDQAWAVDIKWEVTGSLVPLVGGTWHLRLNIDQLGGPGDFPFPPANSIDVPVTPANGSYRQAVNVPANTLAAGPGGNTYQVLASLTYTTPAGTPGPIAGYVNCGMVQVIA